MASTITHTQTRTVPSPGNYQVQDTVTAASGIGLEDFVFNTSDGLFSHVATAYDMVTYPITQAAAVIASLSFYRQVAVTKVFTDINVAIEFGATLRQRLTSLAIEYDLVVSSFTAGSPQTETLP